jgi:hypothetical protein
MQALDLYFDLSMKSYAPFPKRPFPCEHRLPSPACRYHEPPHILTPPTAHASHAPHHARVSLIVHSAAFGVLGTLARRVKKTQVAVHSS